MIVCVPVTPEGRLDHSWGRAHRVAIATVGEGGIEGWQEHEVAWDELHDTGSEGSHHARVARFLREHEVDAVVARRMGPAMHNMLGKMGLTVRTGASGDARAAALAVATGPASASG
jgi:predicted Fe-Mo cluster-binding NifX family protein